MTDYSRMTYDELRQIADNDSGATHLPDEEYERLSVELWRKFGAEKALTEQYPGPEPIVAAAPATLEAAPETLLDITGLEASATGDRS